MKLKELIEKLPEVISVNGNLDVTVKSVEEDSRRVKKASLFVAIKGYNKDGHDFIHEAVKSGAKAIIGEKELNISGVTYIRVKDSRKALAAAAACFNGYPASKLKIVGVTGTSGKTTTTYLLKAMLQEAGKPTGVIGTIGNVVDGDVLPAEHTTPGPLQLNELFSKMLQQNVRHVVMEVSSHSLKLHRVYGVTFEVGVFTNLTQDHLDFHKTFEDYFNSKKKLFDSSKRAVINIDDESGRRLHGMIKNIPVLTYAVKNKADLMAENIKIREDGVSYDLVYNKERYTINYSVPGMFSVYNSLAALASGISMGISVDVLSKALNKVHQVEGRFELVENKKGLIIIVDYAHKPDGLKNVLTTIREFCKGNVITVFGCGGNRDKGKRPIMGEIASMLSDYAIITSDNPRDEDPEAIIDQIESGIRGNSYEKIVDRKQAIHKAISMAKKGDAILIAGKGHENYQILGDKIIHFNDKEVVKECLNNGGY